MSVTVSLEQEVGQKKREAFLENLYWLVLWVWQCQIFEQKSLCWWVLLALGDSTCDQTQIERLNETFPEEEWHAWAWSESQTGGNRN